jgi:hypothetical protein
MAYAITANKEAYACKLKEGLSANNEAQSKDLWHVTILP